MPLRIAQAAPGVVYIHASTSGRRIRTGSQRKLNRLRVILLDGVHERGGLLPVFIPEDGVEVVDAEIQMMWARVLRLKATENWMGKKTAHRRRQRM